MFLTVDRAGEEALFSLAPLTRQFVASKKEALQFYSVLRERVKAFKRNVYVSNPRVAQEVLRVERLIPPRYAEHAPEKSSEAWKIVTDSKLTPNVTEDPLFRSLFGYVASACSPPRLTEAREAFGYASQMKFEPDFRYLLAWFGAEKNSGVLDKWCERIADLVISGKRYAENEKIEMIFRKGSSLYARGRDRLATDSVDALACLREALALHLRAFRLNCLTGNPWADLSERWARNTAFTLFNAIPKDTPWEVVDDLRRLAEIKELYLDPIEDPLNEYLGSAAGLLRKRDAISRTRQRLKGLVDLVGRESLWLANSPRQRTSELINRVDKVFAETLERLSDRAAFREG